MRGCRSCKHGATLRPPLAVPTIDEIHCHALACACCPAVVVVRRIRRNGAVPARPDQHRHPEQEHGGGGAVVDIDDAVVSCGQHKCRQVSTLTATYKRLLTLEADTEASGGSGDAIDANAPGPDHDGDVAFNTAVPKAAPVASLLDNPT